MSRIILDVSANTHKNDWNCLKRMLDELKAIDTGKHEIIIKHQLFEKAGENIPLDREIFDKAYLYAKDLGYKTTSSVFDRFSLSFLLEYDVPFIKIANNRKLDWLIGEIPRKIPIYISIGQLYSLENDRVIDWDTDSELQKLLCVSEYPTTIESYEKIFKSQLRNTEIGISDHTTNWDLYNKYNPEIYECHYKMPNSTGLDAGLFSRTPEMLKEVL